MEYLFLRRKKTRYNSVRQKTLLYRAASRRWEKEFALPKSHLPFTVP